MSDPKTPFLDAYPAAVDLVAELMAMTHAALSFADAETGLPGISRIAFGLGPDGVPMTLISGLTAHAPALRRHADCAVMLGDVGARGDPLTHPRLMIRARAEFAAPSDRPALRDHWLKGHPKAALYVDLPDFAFVHLRPQSALLNAGFGRAHLIPVDLL
jgi:putative heme iron utilization protein